MTAHYRRRRCCNVLVFLAGLFPVVTSAYETDVRTEGANVSRAEANAVGETDATPLSPDGVKPRRNEDDGNVVSVQTVLEFARQAYDRMNNNVTDYTCRLTKRERVNGVLGDYQYMHAKIRHAQKDGDTVVVPFGVYLRFHKPRSVEGREVLFVEGKWNGDVLARCGGTRTPNLVKFLDPLSPLAMGGNRYPITEIGMRTLAKRVIEVLQLEQHNDNAVIEVFPNAKISGCPCICFRLTHVQFRPGMCYSSAELAVDKERGIPIYFRSFGWPLRKGEVAPLLEEYFYDEIRVNVGLNDWDFDPKNPKYGFERR